MLTKAFEPPGTGVTGEGGGGWKSNVSFLDEHCMLLTAEPFPQPLQIFSRGLCWIWSNLPAPKSHTNLPASLLYWKQESPLQFCTRTFVGTDLCHTDVYTLT